LFIDLPSLVSLNAPSKKRLAANSPRTAGFLMYRELIHAARMFALGLIAVLLLIWAAAVAWSQDGGPHLRDWWRSVIRMDGVNCCAEYDAVWADWIGTHEGKYVVQVTGGGPWEHAWAPIGRVYVLDQSFVVWNRGNPLGRPIIFLSPSTLEPICFVPAGGV